MKDNGIGIDENKLNQIQNCLQDTIEFEGLTESKDNKLTISSKKNKGKIVQFQIEDLQQKNLVYSLFPNQQSENQMANQSEYNIQNLDQNKIILLSNKTTKLENDRDFQELKSESFITLRLNDVEKQPEIFLPISSDYLKKKNLNYQNKIQTQLQTDNFKNEDFLCQKCVHILIVDDIPFNQIALKILSKYQIEVDQTFDGFQAIQKVKQKILKHWQNYKLIFMDMPGWMDLSKLTNT